jgi:hypothetical protein
MNRYPTTTAIPAATAKIPISGHVERRPGPNTYHSVTDTAHRSTRLCWRSDFRSNRTIVATRDTAYIKNHPTATAQRRGTNGGYFCDALMDDYLSAAAVLRPGHDGQG